MPEQVTIPKGRVYWLSRDPKKPADLYAWMLRAGFPYVAGPLAADLESRVLADMAQWPDYVRFTPDDIPEFTDLPERAIHWKPIEGSLIERDLTVERVAD